MGVGALLLARQRRGASPGEAVPGSLAIRLRRGGQYGGRSSAAPEPLPGLGGTGPALGRGQGGHPEPMPQRPRGYLTMVTPDCQTPFRWITPVADIQASQQETRTDGK